MQAGTLLEVRGLWKSYGTPVLQDVAFAVRAGEVHALVGENGAGKSTLSRIVAGLTPPDRGELRWKGAPYRPRNKADAGRQGVRMVLQELHLIGNLSIAENLFLEHLPQRLGWIRFGSLHARAQALMREVGLGDLPPERLVKTLGVGQQQLVEIGAGLSQQCDLLILDEPTAALTEPEIARLFAQIARLKARGVGLIYISHRLEEVRQIADRVTVLRDGRVVDTQPAAALSLEDLVRRMVGRDLAPLERPGARTAGAEALRVEGLCCPPAVRDVSFAVHRGEILGFAGLMGAGRTETMRAVFGADRAAAGAVYLHGAARPARIGSPRDAVRQGVALLTEDRKQQGLLLPLSVRFNLTWPVLGRFCRRLGWIRSEAEATAVERAIAAWGIRCASAGQAVRELSGGNQQKVVLARWLLRHCDILIFDEPTRGIDVGAKFEIYRLLGQLADQGKALIVVSSDLLELMAVSDRIAVMSGGRLTATFARGAWTQEQIMAAALSGLVTQQAA